MNQANFIETFHARAAANGLTYQSPLYSLISAEKMMERKDFWLKEFSGETNGPGLAGFYNKNSGVGVPCQFMDGLTTDERLPILRVKGNANLFASRDGGKKYSEWIMNIGSQSEISMNKQAELLLANNGEGLKIFKQHFENGMPKSMKVEAEPLLGYIKNIQSKRVVVSLKA